MTIEQQEVQTKTTNMNVKQNEIGKIVKLINEDGSIVIKLVLPKSFIQRFDSRLGIYLAGEILKSTWGNYNLEDQNYVQKSKMFPKGHEKSALEYMRKLRQELYVARANLFPVNKETSEIKVYL